MNRCEFLIGRKCYYRNNDWPYNELIHTHFQQPDASNDDKKQLLLAKYQAYQGLFSESARIYKKINASHLALEMFTDLQMYDQAKEYQHNNNNSGEQRQRQQQQVTLVAENFTNQKQQQRSNNNDFSDLQTLCNVCIAKGDYEKAFEIISKSDVNRLVFVRYIFLIHRI